MAIGLKEKPGREQPGALPGPKDTDKYCLLTTFRRGGEGVATPLWFATDAGTLYVRTGVESGKLKRIARTPGVTVAPCTLRGRPRGPAVEGVARVVNDPEEEARAEKALSAKYGITRPLIMRFLHWRGVEELYVAVELGDPAQRALDEP